MPKMSETITENIFRQEYNNNASTCFIEKSAIPKEYGFCSKKGTDKEGYPDFFRDENDFSIVVEAKADDIESAEQDVCFYLNNNKMTKDLIGYAIAGQSKEEIKITYFLKIYNTEIRKLEPHDVFLSIKDIRKLYNTEKHGEIISDSDLIKFLNTLNTKFNTDNKVRDSDRSLFFSGILIALTNVNFRNTYQNISAPENTCTTQAKILESHNLNNAILSAISSQLSDRINNLSKEFSWVDRFAFIKNIDYPLTEYKQIIRDIEDKIYNPFQNEEKQDILGKAYKIFLMRAGRAENKNIILTPDHIKSLMVKLANLNVDDVVIDTCTGSGGFLMEAMENLIKLAQGNPEKIQNIKEKQLIGFEIDPILFSLACSNMFLHGDGKTNLLFRSSLLQNTSGLINTSDRELLDYIKRLKPTKCIINPPYEKNNAFNFTKQAIDYLESNGKLIIIMPVNTLAKNEERTKKLLEKASLDFVIKMPQNLFTEQKRTINTAIFGFTKSPHVREKKVLFYTLEEDGLISIQHKGRIDKYNKWNKIQDQIINVVINPQETQGFSELKEIYSKEGILNTAGVLTNKDNHHMIKISEAFDIEKGSLQSESNDDGEYDFITASKEWKKHSSYTHDTEAIIYAVAASGSLGRTHYVKGKFIASDLCLILTQKKDTKYPINLQFYNEYFNTFKKKIVSDLASGASKLSINKPDFENYYIDYISLEEQNKLLPEILEQQQKMEQLKKELEKQEKEINNRISELISNN